jgi:hypothetical protein
MDTDGKGFEKLLKSYTRKCEVFEAWRVYFIEHARSCLRHVIKFGITRLDLIPYMEEALHAMHAVIVDSTHVEYQRLFNVYERVSQQNPPDHVVVMDALGRTAKYPRIYSRGAVVADMQGFQVKSRGSPKYPSQHGIDRRIIDCNNADYYANPPSELEPVVDADFDEFYNVEFNNDETDTAETDIEF